MFDTVHKYICLFRCDFCLELLPLRGSVSKMNEHKVFLVTENPRMYLKQYDWEEASHMDWISSCGDCLNSGSMVDYLSENKVIKTFTPHKDAPTIDALTSLMRHFDVSISLKSKIMDAAHFVGERPVF